MEKDLNGGILYFVHTSKIIKKFERIHPVSLHDIMSYAEELAVRKYKKENRIPYRGDEYKHGKEPVRIIEKFFNILHNEIRKIKDCKNLKDEEKYMQTTIEFIRNFIESYSNHIVYNYLKYIIERWEFCIRVFFK